MTTKTPNNQDKKKELREECFDLAKRNHCRYCSGGDDGIHTKCKMDIRAEAEEIYQVLKQAKQEGREDERQQTLLELLAMFDDYNHPIQMTAEYVREQIIKFMDEDENK